MLEKLAELVEKYPNLAQEVYPIIIGACILVWLFITSILVIDSIIKRKKWLEGEENVTKIFRMDIQSYGYYINRVYNMVYSNSYIRNLCMFRAIYKV